MLGPSHQELVWYQSGGKERVVAVESYSRRVNLRAGDARHILDRVTGLSAQLLCRLETPSERLLPYVLPEVLR